MEGSATSGRPKVLFSGISSVEEERRSTWEGHGGVQDHSMKSDHPQYVGGRSCSSSLRQQTSSSAQREEERVEATGSSSFAKDIVGASGKGNTAIDIWHGRIKVKPPSPPTRWCVYPSFRSHEKQEAHVSPGLHVTKEEENEDEGKGKSVRQSCCITEEERSTPHPFVKRRQGAPSSFSSSPNDPSLIGCNKDEKRSIARHPDIQARALSAVCHPSSSFSRMPFIRRHGNYAEAAQQDEAIRTCAGLSSHDRSHAVMGRALSCPLFTTPGDSSTTVFTRVSKTLSPPPYSSRSVTRPSSYWSAISRRSRRSSSMFPTLEASSSCQVTVLSTAMKREDARHDVKTTTVTTAPVAAVESKEDVIPNPPPPRFSSDSESLVAASSSSPPLMDHDRAHTSPLLRAFFTLATKRASTTHPYSYPFGWRASHSVGSSHSHSGGQARPSGVFTAASEGANTSPKQDLHVSNGSRCDSSLAASLAHMKPRKGQAYQTEKQTDKGSNSMVNSNLPLGREKGRRGSVKGKPQGAKGPSWTLWNAPPAPSKETPADGCQSIATEISEKQQNNEVSGDSRKRPPRAVEPEDMPTGPEGKGPGMGSSSLRFSSHGQPSRPSTTSSSLPCAVVSPVLAMEDDTTTPWGTSFLRSPLLGTRNPGSAHSAPPSTATTASFHEDQIGKGEESGTTRVPVFPRVSVSSLGISTTKKASLGSALYPASSPPVEPYGSFTVEHGQMTEGKKGVVGVEETPTRTGVVIDGVVRSQSHHSHTSMSSLITSSSCASFAAGRTEKEEKASPSWCSIGAPGDDEKEAIRHPLFRSREEDSSSLSSSPSSCAEGCGCRTDEKRREAHEKKEKKRRNEDALLTSSRARDNMSPPSCTSISERFGFVRTVGPHGIQRGKSRNGIVTPDSCEAAANMEDTGKTAAPWSVARSHPSSSCSLPPPSHDDAVTEDTAASSAISSCIEHDDLLSSLCATRVEDTRSSPACTPPVTPCVNTVTENGNGDTEKEEEANKKEKTTRAKKDTQHSTAGGHHAVSPTPMHDVEDRKRNKSLSPPAIQKRSGVSMTAVQAASPRDGTTSKEANETPTCFPLMPVTEAPSRSGEGEGNRTPYLPFLQETPASAASSVSPALIGKRSTPNGATPPGSSCLPSSMKDTATAALCSTSPVSVSNGSYRDSITLPPSPSSFSFHREDQATLAVGASFLSPSSLLKVPSEEATRTGTACQSRTAREERERGERIAPLLHCAVTALVKNQEGSPIGEKKRSGPESQQVPEQTAGQDDCAGREHAHSPSPPSLPPSLFSMRPLATERDGPVPSPYAGASRKEEHKRVALVVLKEEEMEERKMRRKEDVKKEREPVRHLDRCRAEAALFAVPMEKESSLSSKRNVTDSPRGEVAPGRTATPEGTSSLVPSSLPLVISPVRCSSSSPMHPTSHPSSFHTVGGPAMIASHRSSATTVEGMTPTIGTTRRIHSLTPAPMEEGDELTSPLMSPAVSDCPTAVGGHHLVLKCGRCFLKEACAPREERFYEEVRPYQERLVQFASAMPVVPLTAYHHSTGWFTTTPVEESDEEGGAEHSLSTEAVVPPVASSSPITGAPPSLSSTALQRSRMVPAIAKDTVWHAPFPGKPSREYAELIHASSPAAPPSSSGVFSPPPPPLPSSSVRLLPPSSPPPASRSYRPSSFSSSASSSMETFFNLEKGAEQWWKLADHTTFLGFQASYATQKGEYSPHWSSASLLPHTDHVSDTFSCHVDENSSKEVSRRDKLLEETTEEVVEGTRRFISSSPSPSPSPPFTSEVTNTLLSSLDTLQPSQGKKEETASRTHQASLTEVEKQTAGNKESDNSSGTEAKHRDHSEVRRVERNEQFKMDALRLMASFIPLYRGKAIVNTGEAVKSRTSPCFPSSASTSPPFPATSVEAGGVHGKRREVLQKEKSSTVPLSAAPGTTTVSSPATKPHMENLSDTGEEDGVLSSAGNDTKQRRSVHTREEGEKPAKREGFSESIEGPIMDPVRPKYSIVSTEVWKPSTLHSGGFHMGLTAHKGSVHEEGSRRGTFSRDETEKEEKEEGTKSSGVTPPHRQSPTTSHATEVSILERKMMEPKEDENSTTSPQEPALPASPLLSPSTSSSVEVIVLEDVCHGFQYPCVLDMKMGKRQYGLRASEKKRQSKTMKANMSTSGKYGIRLAGYRKFDMETQSYQSRGKVECRYFNLEKLHEELHYFLNHQRSLALRFREQLERLRAAFSLQRVFRFFTSSLLFVYDAVRPLETARVVMVDFAFTYERQELQAEKDEDAVFDFDIGYIKALDTLLSLLA